MMISSSPAEVQRTLTSLQSFFDSHAFDTEGPYADIFAVLLSTCKHLIDTNIAQQRRIADLEEGLSRARQEAAALCEQSVKTSDKVREVQGGVEETQKQLRGLVLADCQRVAALASEREGSANAHAAKRGGGALDRRHEEDVEDEDFRRFARGVSRRMREHESTSNSLSKRVQWLVEHIGRLDHAQHSIGKQVDKLSRSQRPEGHTKQREGSPSSPPRPLEVLSEVVDMERDDRFLVLQRRVKELAEDHASLSNRLSRVNAAAEVAKAAGEAARRDAAHDLAKLQKDVDRLASTLQTWQTRQAEQQRQREPTPPRVPAASAAAVALTEDDFLLPSPTRKRSDAEGGASLGGSGGHSTSSQQQQQLKALRSRMWEDWLILLKGVRRSITTGEMLSLGSATSHPTAAAAACELQALLQSESPHSPSLLTATAQETITKLADQLDTLSGRVEVLEVYAPHTYTVATRPPLLGMELADSSSPVSGAAPLLRVTNVFTGFLADQMGISPGDAILAVDGTAVSSRAELYVVLREKTRHHQVKCQLILEGAFVASSSPSRASDASEAGAAGVMPPPSPLSPVAQEPRSAEVQEKLPHMRLSLTVKRGEEVRETVLSIPARVCWPQPSW